MLDAGGRFEILVLCRALRVEYPGAIYHVMDRGGRREDIFINDVDRQHLLKTLAEACEKTGWQIHAYCLMRNHFSPARESCGELHRETAEQKANRIIGEELVYRHWQESDLAVRPRSDPGKLAIAARLRKETTLPIRWIAARVKIGTPKGAKAVLHRLAHGRPASHKESCAQLEFQSTV
jgi:hypothetical protein